MEENTDKKKGFGAGKAKFDPKKKLSRSLKKKTDSSSKDKDESTEEKATPKEDKPASIDAPSKSEKATISKPKKEAKPDFSKFVKEEKADRSSEKETASRSEKKAEKPSTYDKPDKFEKTKKFDRKERSSKFDKPFAKKPFKSSKKEEPKRPKKNDLVRLNKYIANSGVCSRREADKLIEQGLIKVNGEVITQLGTKIKFGDKVQHDGNYLRGEQHVYLLLNKPKDFITTSKDPQGRKTVMDLIGSKCKERVYPVGRLDRNTTGLLMLTNDGELASKLTHPKHEIKKLYQVETDHPVKPEDLDTLMSGVTLEDGDAKADNAAYAGGKNVIGIELHSGKNRVVRRMFAELGYEVKKLDRVMFAGLTKKDIPRGKWRFLSDKEIAYLKML
jgi:23S rRNA pseudouridine2605 synthase